MPIKLRAGYFDNNIEIIAPMALEECAYQLAIKSDERRRWFRLDYPVIVRINHKTHDHYRFRVRRTIGSIFYVSVLGDLERIDEKSTRVTGHGSISLLIYLLMGLTGAIWIFAFLNDPHATDVSTIILPIIVIAALWASSVSTRDHLMKIVYGTLSNELN